MLDLLYGCTSAPESAVAPNRFFRLPAYLPAGATQAVKPGKHSGHQSGQNRALLITQLKKQGPPIHSNSALPAPRVPLPQPLSQWRSIGRRHPITGPDWRAGFGKKVRVVEATTGTWSQLAL